MINMVDISIIVQNLETILNITKSCVDYFPISFDTHYASRVESEYLEKVKAVVGLLKNPSNINATKIDYVAVSPCFITVNARVADWKVHRKVFFKDSEDKFKQGLMIERGALELAKIVENQGFEIDEIAPIDYGHSVILKKVNGYTILVDRGHNRDELSITLESVNTKVEGINVVTLNTDTHTFLTGNKTIKSVLTEHGLGYILG